MAESMILTAPASMTAPLAGTPILPLRGDSVVLTSDGFGGAAGDLLGRSSDASLGGSAKAWKSNSVAPMLRVNGSGKAIANTAATGGYFYHFEITGGVVREVEVGVRVVDLFSSIIFVDLFRGPSTADRKMRLIVNPTGTGQVTYTAPAGQGSAVVPGGNFTYSAGDRLRFRYHTGTGRTRLWRNDTAILDTTYIPPVPLDGQTFGIAGTTASSGTLDDFTLSETVL